MPFLFAATAYAFGMWDYFQGDIESARFLFVIANIWMATDWLLLEKRDRQ